MGTLMLSACAPVTLKFVDVCYEARQETGDGGVGCELMGRWVPSCCSGGTTTGLPAGEKTILNGVTGMVSPGELLAVLGPSGSGKSTLLSLLAGRLQGKYTGEVVINDRRFSKESMARRTAFVAQDDVLYPHLTVRETLVYCALLRLPRTLTRREKVEAAESVMAELGLEKCRDTIVGNGSVRGVSGGERKRVSIGHEMLMSPSLLLLDEPTSGLDSTAAHRLVATLVGLAHKGKAVVASVHQPSSQVFQMFDKVLLLAEGSCLYFGRGCDAMGYFASAGFSPRFPVNPADFMLDLANGVAQVEGQVDTSNAKHILIRSYCQSIAPDIKACISKKTIPEAGVRNDQQRRRGKEQDYRGIGWFDQFSILLQRGLKERRHEAFNALRVFQVAASAVLAGALWWQSSIYSVQDRLGLLFFMAIFWGVVPATNAVFAFPQERAIFMKERSSGMYSLSSYFVARMVGDLPMELILPTAFTSITYWMAGLKPDPQAFLLTLVVLLGYVLVAQGLGLLLGASIMDAKRASTLVTVIMLAFVLTGGYYVHNIPPCLVWLKHASMTFYCFMLLVRAQYNSMGTGFPSGLTHHGTQNSNSGLVEGHVDTSTAVAVLILMFVVYRLLAYAALQRIKL